MEGAVKLQLGFREEGSPSNHSYPADLFRPTGRYGPPLVRLGALFDGGGYLAWTKDEQRLGLQIVHQCEEARRWAAMDTDIARSSAEYTDTLSVDFADAAKLVKRLKNIDALHPYFLRHAFKSAIEKRIPAPVPLDIQMPDQNHEDGGPSYRADAATQAHIQHTLVWKISLFEFGGLLTDFGSELSSRPRIPNPHRELGCLSFEPTLSRRAATKIRADVAGLSAWLACLIRQWTAGKGVSPMWQGTPMPTDGRPHWDIVADFVNAALPCERMETAESVRQQWHTLSKNRTVRLNHWPRVAFREPQLA